MTTIHFMRRTLTVLAFAVAGGVATPSLITVGLADTPPAEWDGLVRVQNRRLDHFYLLPDVSFAGYTRVRIDRAEVEFDRDWKRNPGGRATRGRVTPREMENIKTSIADEFNRVFSETLTRAGYKVVDEDGEDVLRVLPAVVNLSVTAPSTSSGQQRAYVRSSGHMTLVLELRDSVTGQLLARAVDTAQARNSGFELATPLTNMRDTRRVLQTWADVLLAGLEDAEGRQSTAAASN
jgi:hypothetical protein